MASTATRARRRWPWRLAVLIAALVLFAVFVQLGNWQVARLAWKRDLIARVDARVHAAPVAAPGADVWPAFAHTSARSDHEYLRVTVSGRFLYQHQTRVQATTILGAGYWVLTPLLRENGEIVWVNRGFVPPQWRDESAPSEDAVPITGLLRVSEPHGAFLRKNKPASGRWHSRDIAMLTTARNLPPSRTAPYFIDAAADDNVVDNSTPTPGLTVIRFANNHLVYAITWYGLALGLLAAVGGVWWGERRRQSRSPL